MPLELPIPKLDASLLGAHRLFALTDEALFEACGVRVAFTSRAGGVSTGAYASLNCANHVGDDVQAVQRNRQLVVEALAAGGQRPRLIVPSQVHGANIVDVNDAAGFEVASAEAVQGADGIIVRCDDVAALLNFADCLPTILVAPDGSFAVVHAGWRGAVAHIARKAAELLIPEPSARAGVNAYIGPHIRSECFEVGEEVAERFAHEFGSAALADASHVSLCGAVRRDLQDAGLKAERIADAEVCTVCSSDKYYSYRASNGTCGRNAAVAVRMGTRES